MDWGWCPDEDTAIQYYSDDKEALKKFIGHMRMHDGTGLQYRKKYSVALLDLADELGAEWVATGHHARVDRSRPGPSLLRGHDPDNPRGLKKVTSTI